MGGLVFIGAALLASVICARLDNVFVLASLICLAGFNFKICTKISNKKTKVNFPINQNLL